jgi:hypothetical protein
LQLPGKYFLTSFDDCLVSNHLNGSRGFVRDIPGEHSPDDTSILVGERHGRDIRMPTLAKAGKPSASRILLAPSFAKDCTSAMDHQRAYIAIAAFADAEQSVSPATRPLLGHQPQPCSELTAILEAAPIPNGSNKGGSGHRSDAFNFPKPLAQLASTIQLSDPPITGCDPAIELDQFGLDLDNQLADQHVEVIWGIPCDLGKSPSQLPDVAGDYNAMFGEDATYLIHESRPASHQALANPMESLDRQLFGRLGRNKAHRGSADRLADSLCIIPIVFVRFHIRRHKLRAYQAHLVTKLRKQACPVVRTVGSFHPDQARRKIGKKRRHRAPTQGFAYDNVPMNVDAMNLKHVLRQVQANSNDLHDDPPSLQFTSDIRPAGRAGSIPLAPAVQEGI